MTAFTRRLSTNFSDILGSSWRQVRRENPFHRGMAFGLIILVGLVAFETFNFSTTEFALADLLGDLSFAGVHWATILALAFCSIDFAGIARLMTPEQDGDPPMEIWYLLGAWFLGATMNAMLTWWSVSLALINHAGLGNEVLGREALLTGVPLFIAALVWLIRILLIGTLTLAGGRLFSFSDRRANSRRRSQARPASRPSEAAVAASSSGRTTSRSNPVPRREPQYAPNPAVARGRGRR
ncbi:MAG: hypothetical protein ACLFWD_09385 [Anaerolineales bacterium]